MSTVMRAEDLCVTLKIPRRPEKELVRHVNFEVQRGECLGILGESGSGKSMSIKAMLVWGKGSLKGKWGVPEKDPRKRDRCGLTEPDDVF